PPGRALAATLAKLFGEEPEAQAYDDLRRFKQVIETGDVVRSEGTPGGTSLVNQLKQRAAHPLGGEREPVDR
ncbi:MAG: cyclase, partial [Actinomycetota bacterium]|nr:cyclase [Actinomycetota bacterium]